MMMMMMLRLQRQKLQQRFARNNVKQEMLTNNFPQLNRWIRKSEATSSARAPLEETPLARRSEPVVEARGEGTRLSWIGSGEREM